MRSTTPRKGFTLIELLIVVAIIGILAAIAVPNFLNAQMRAKLSQVESNMKALRTATMAYFTDHSKYPLHDHVYNCRGLTTPVSYIAQIPFDIFQEQSLDNTTPYLLSDNRATIHPEPFYTIDGGAYGQSGADRMIPDFNNKSLCLVWRFYADRANFEKARGQYPNGRYFVSVGPNKEHNAGYVYDASNGLYSYGDIIRVTP